MFNSIKPNQYLPVPSKKCTLLPVTHKPNIQNENTNKLPFLHDKIPVSSGLVEFRAFAEQFPEYIFCPYLADKIEEDWNISTSRVYMNQVLPGFLYVPVNVPKNDVQGLIDVFEAVKDNQHIAAVNITQPHKSSGVVRKIFLGDETSHDNIDTLIRNSAGVLEPYDLNAPAFVSWFKDEAGSFVNKTVVLVGVGGVGEPMAKAIAKEAPARLVLIDPSDKTKLAEQLHGQVAVSYYNSVRAAQHEELGTDLILINAAGKEGVTDNTGITNLLNHYKGVQNMFVDIRPQLDIEIVEVAKGLDWQAFTGYGMNARNDYTLLAGIAEYMGLMLLPFSDFQELVAKAS